MKRLKLVPDNTSFSFVKFRHIAVGLSVAVMLASVVLLFARGLNFGIDFEGGTVIEIATKGPADISGLRTQLGGLGLGDLQLQRFGEDNDVLIRIGTAHGASATDDTGQAAVKKVKDTLGTSVEYRRIESVGPQVSGELIKSATMAVVVAVALMFVYIWFRFEWQFGLGAVLALIHDVMATIGIFALLQMEFNLTTIAALLTIVGYSMNDTVVVFDRIRENLRKFKKMDLGELIDLSINETLARTIMTSATTLIALFALFIFGGEVIRSFTFAMIFGIFVGTYSSIFVAAPVLIAIGVKREWGSGALGRGKVEKKA
ncbi:protein translocase subunit SecF [Parvibaculum sedimenti]|uniref:Protein-export membrane protein SecF n=1 Tax=Parvibaculum sedimenti TaxID=2608632 RepID=A0A6N6VLX1_9HYPH|nr:protein translocase subunit SecF [Parvibaculum sedimenti]KAB7739643.1 protein translocase subunit SecF [Parvibaculum sedimenti]